MSVAWALPLLVVMQTRSAGVSPRPVAWAAQSPRPAACLGAPGLWEISRQALVGRRCRELARIQTLLLRAPERALERALALSTEVPDMPEARVLRGRAHLRVGNYASALADLRPLLETEASVAGDPAALLDGGRAAIAQGDLPNAARFYRALGNRAALLGDRSQQVVAYIEIAATLLTDDAVPVDDVLAYLREARRRSAGSGFTGLAAALTAVAWISRGRSAEGQAALAEIEGPMALVRFETRADVWLPDGLFHALIGLALEHERPELAAEHYQALARSSLAQSSLGRLSGRLRGRTPSAKLPKPGVR